MTERMNPRIRDLTLCALAFLSPAVAAADLDFSALRDVYRQLVKASDVATGYAAMINFESEPNLSSSTLWIDNDQLNPDVLKVTKFPLRKEFDLSGHDWKPFVQLTLAKLDLKSTAQVFVDEKVKADWSSYSASLGGGVRIPLAEGWSILPAADFGYATLSSSVKYRGALGNQYLRPLLDQLLFDWSADAWLANAHLALQYKGTVGPLDLDARLGGTYSHIESFRSTTDLQEFRENIGTLSFKIDGTYPLGVSMAGYPLAVIGHLGASTFVGPNRDVLGFTEVYEAGLSLQADISRHGLPVSKLSLGLMGLYGDNVEGVSVLFGYDF